MEPIVIAQVVQKEEADTFIQSLKEKNNLQSEKELQSQILLLESIGRFDLLLNLIRSLPKEQQQTYDRFRAISHFHLGQFDEAKKMALQCLELGINKISKLSCATLLIRLNEADAAKAYLQTIDQKTLTPLETAYLMQAYLALKDYQALNELMIQLNEAKKNHPKVLIAEAEYLMRLSKENEAFDLALKAAEKRPFDPEVNDFFRHYEGREKILLEQKQLYEGLLNKEEGSLQAKLDYAKVLIELAIIKAKAKQTDESKELLSRSYIFLKDLQTTLKELPEWWRLMALYYYLTKDNEAAKNSAEKLLKLDPSAWSGYQILSLIAIETKDFKEAEQILKKALPFQRDNPEINEELSLVLIENGKLDEAFTFINNAIEIAPKRSKYYLSAASIALKQNLSEKAKAIIKKGLENIPEDEALQKKAVELEKIKAKE